MPCIPFSQNLMEKPNKRLNTMSLYSHISFSANRSEIFLAISESHNYNSGL